MTDDLHALAAAVVASPHWRWMPGMLAAGPAGPKGGRKRARVESRFADDITPKCVDFNGRRVPASYACMCEANEVVPDLSDPATLGCLLALVREAWGDPSACVSTMLYSQRWRCHVHDPGPSRTPRWFDADSEPAALVSALLAAPPPAR